MNSIIRTLTTALAVTAVVATATVARGDNYSNGESRWPSELEQQLVGLDAELIDLQQKLFTAKQTNDTAGTELYTQQFNACQSQRMTILESMGLVSVNDTDE